LSWYDLLAIEIFTLPVRIAEALITERTQKNKESKKGYKAMCGEP